MSEYSFQTWKKIREAAQYFYRKDYLALSEVEKKACVAVALSDERKPRE